MSATGISIRKRDCGQAHRRRWRPARPIPFHGAENRLSTRGGSPPRSRRARRGRSPCTWTSCPDRCPAWS
ncbi:hypothetical protein ACFFX0_21765 [Citricoccus parietis]|uniref:Uncharacterized protein n=1 Tax=Citricoccus parietis TaxID=592307 RepID=A0ABV5G411_9MICC